MSFLNTLLPSFGDKKEAFSQGLSLLLSKDSTNPEQVKDHMMKLFKSMEFSDAASADFAEAVARHWKEVHGRVIEISTSAVKSLAGGIFGRAEGSAAGITRQSAFEKRMHKFIEELKSPKGAFASMPAANGDDISPILKWFQEKVPMEGGRLRLKASGDHIAVAKYLALKLNNAFQAGINPDAPPEVLMRDVYVALSAIQAGLSSDFVAIYAAMNRFSDNIDMLLSALEVVRKEVGDLQPDQVGRRDELSQALGETIKALRSNSQLLRSTLHSDALRQLVGPDAVADSVLSQRFNNIMKLENVDNSQQVSFLLSRVNRLFQITNALSGWSKTLEDHAKGVLAAFFNEKLSQEEFRKLISEKLADVKLTTVVSPGTSTSKPTSMEEILKRLEQSRMELLDSGRMGDVKATLAERGEYTGSGYSGMAELPRHETIKTQIERVREGRKTLIKAAVTRVSALFSQVISCIQSLTEGVMAGSVPRSAGLHNLQNDLALLKDLGSSKVFYPLLGVYVVPEQGVERHRFINSLMVLKNRAAGLSSESPIYGRLSEAIGSLLTFIEEAQAQNRSTYTQGLMSYGAIGGGVGDPYAIDLDVLPQLKTAMVRYSEQLQELMYAISFHQGLRRMQRAGKDMEGSEEQHARARAEAFGYKQTEVKTERDKLLNVVNEATPEATTPGINTRRLFNIGNGGAADNAEMTAARDMIRDMYEAKLKFLQTAEAFDSMLEKFMRGASKDPKIFYELYQEIMANPGIADWFNESSGNMLAQWFEAFPIYANGLGNPVGKKNFSIGTREHYYDKLSGEAVLHDLKADAEVGRGPLFPWNLGNHLVPNFPSAYAEHKRKSRMVYQGTAALKNILTAFVNVAKQLGHEQIFSFMTPTTMYQNLIEYLTVSAFSRGFGTYDPTVKWIAMTADAAPAIDPTVVLQNAINPGYFNVLEPPAPGGAINVPYTTDVPANELKTGIHNLNLRGNNTLSTFAFDANRGLGRIYVGAAASPTDNYIAYNDVTPGDPAALLRVFLRTQYGFVASVVYSQLKSTFDDTDMIFVTILQGIYSKIMTAVNIDKMLHRPLARTQFMAVRSFIGGDEAIPEIRPDFLRVYFGLILLAEFYRDLFDFKGKGDKQKIGTHFISMLPEGASPYGPLIACVFDRYATITNGEYSDIQVRNLISICNDIIDKTSGSSADDKIDAIFDNFISEVNKRYAVMEDADAVEYQNWLNTALPGAGQDFQSTEGDRADDLLILPGEDDAFRFDGIAPSTSYTAASPNDAGRYKQWQKTTLEDKWRQLINRWRSRTDAYLIDADDKSLMTWRDKSVIGDLLRDAEMDVRLAKDPYSRYVEVLKLVSTSSSEYSSDANKVLMLQEVLGGIELLKQTFAQLAKAADVIRYLSDPELIFQASHDILTVAGNATLGMRLSTLAQSDFSFGKYIGIAGSHDANVLDACLGLLWAKPSGDIPAARAITREIFGINVYSAAQYNPTNALAHIGTNNNGEQLSNYWFEKDNESATKANRMALFQTVFDHDMMFADLIQVCIDLDHVNIGAAASGAAKLVDVVIRDGAVSVNFSNLRQHVFAMFEHLQSLMNSLRSTLPKKDLEPLEGNAGLGLATLRFLFMERLFQDRRTSEDNPLNLGEFNQNLSRALASLPKKGSVKVTPFIAEFAQSSWAAPLVAFAGGADKTGIAQALTSVIRHHPRTVYFPRYNENAFSMVNLEEVFRAFTHFNAKLPNSGIPYVAKELRTELPIYGETAPPLDKTRKGMYWKHEIGFPDALKMPSQDETYSNHSLLFDFNRGLFNYVNDIFDMGNGKIYTKAIQSLLSGQVGSAARVENSFPDTLPNMNAIQAHISSFGATAAAEREPFLTNLYGKPMAGIMYDRSATRDPGNWAADANAFRTSFSAPFSDLVVSTFGDTFGANADNLKNYGVSLEQYMLATRFFSSKNGGSYVNADRLRISNATGSSGSITTDQATTVAGGNTVAAISNYVMAMSGYSSGARDAANWIGSRVVPETHKFVQNLHRLIPNKVPYRAPRAPGIDIGWGIRRDPRSTGVVMTSVAVLLHEIATNKVEGETGYRHQYTSLADVPDFVKETMRCKMPYYMSYFGALAARTNILRSFLNSLQVDSSPDFKEAMYEEIDPSDVTLSRTEVWAGHFKSSALQFMNEIQRLSDETRAMINEAYMDLTDVPRLMELPGSIGYQMANAGLALAMGALRYDTDTMTKLALASSGTDDPAAYRYLYGLRGLLGLSSQLEPAKNLPGYVEIVAKYNGVVDVSFKIGDALRDQFAGTFVTLYRWVVGNRVFKPATLNQTKFQFSQVKVRDALPMVRPNALTANQNTGPYVDAAVGNPMIKFLLLFSEFLPVRGTSRFNDVFTSLSDEVTAGNNGNELWQQGRTNQFAKLFNSQLLLTNIITDDQDSRQIVPNGDRLVGSNLAMTMLGGQLQLGSYDPTPSHTVAERAIQQLKVLLKLSDEPDIRPQLYALKSDNQKSLRDIVDVVANPDVQSKLKEVVRHIMGVAAGTTIPRSKMRSLLVQFLNLVPINPNVLGREVGYAHGYNAAFNFRRLMAMRLGINFGDRQALLGVDKNELDSSSSMSELWYRLLANPYAAVSISNYERLIGGFMRGNNELDLGRPKFLSDQVYSKALFGSLYESADDKQPIGPKAAKLTGRGSSEKTAVDAFCAAHTITTGITNLLIANEQNWQERDTKLAELVADKSYLFRVPLAQLTGANTRASFTTNHVFEIMEGDAFHYKLHLTKVGGDTFQQALFRTQLTMQLLKLREISGGDMTAATIAHDDWYVASGAPLGAALTPYGTDANAAPAADTAGDGGRTIGAVVSDAANNWRYGAIPYVGAGAVQNIALPNIAAINNANNWQAVYEACRAAPDTRTLHMLLRYSKRYEPDNAAAHPNWQSAGLHDGAGAPEIVPQRYMAPNCGLIPVQEPLSRFALGGSVRALLEQILVPVARHVASKAIGELTHAGIKELALAGLQKSNSPLAQMINATISGLANVAAMDLRYKDHLPNSSPAMPHLGVTVARNVRSAIAASNQAIQTEIVNTTASIDATRLDVLAKAKAIYDTKNPQTKQVDGVDVSDFYSSGFVGAAAGEVYARLSTVFTREATNGPFMGNALVQALSVANQTLKARIDALKTAQLKLTNMDVDIQNAIAANDTTPAGWMGGFLCMRPFNHQIDTYQASYYHHLHTLFDDTASVTVTPGQTFGNPDTIPAVVSRGFSYFAAGNSGVTTSEIVGIEKNRVAGFAALVAVAYEALSLLIPNEGRRDLILTNALFARHYKYSLATLSDTARAAERAFYQSIPSAAQIHSSGAIYFGFVEALIKHISSSEDVYMPYDHTYYDVSALHNVSIGHGGEVAALALSTTAMPTLLSAFRTPAICLPVVRATNAALTGAGEPSTQLGSIRDKVRTLLTSLLASSGDFSSMSYEGKCKLLERVWPSLFGEQAIGSAIPGVGVPDKWYFSFTRGSPAANSMHVAKALFPGEALQAEKSRCILLQHAKFLMLVHHLAQDKITGPVDSTASYTTAVQAMLTAIGTDTFFGSSYYRYFNSSNNVIGGKVDGTPTEKIMAMAINRFNAYPIKFGAACFLSGVNSLGGALTNPLIAPPHISDSNAHAVNFIGAPAAGEFAAGYTVPGAEARGYANMPITRGLRNGESMGRFSKNTRNNIANADGDAVAAQVDGAGFKAVSAMLSSSLVTENNNYKQALKNVNAKLADCLFHKTAKYTIELGALVEGMPFSYLGDEARHVLLDRDARTFWAPIDKFTDNASYVYTKNRDINRVDPMYDRFDPVLGLNSNGSASFLEAEAVYIKASGLDLANGDGAMRRSGLPTVAADGSNATNPVRVDALIGRANVGAATQSARVNFDENTYLGATLTGRNYEPVPAYNLTGVVTALGMGEIAVRGFTVADYFGVDKDAQPIAMNSAAYRMARRALTIAIDGEYSLDYAHMSTWLSNHGLALFNGALSQVTVARASLPLAVAGDVNINESAVTYTSDAALENTEYAFHEPYHAVYLGNDGAVKEVDFSAAEGDAMRKIGKYRFDTKMVRNLVFIHNIHNLLAYDIEAALTDLSKAKVYGRNVFHPQLHEYAGNRNYQSDKENRTRDTSDWTPLTMHE